jgi:putative ABC transport system permease protein
MTGHGGATGFSTFRDADVPRPKTFDKRLLALLSLAWREGRSGRRRLFLYMSAISLGVAALVAIDSFAENVNRSIHEQSKALLGGDVSFFGRQGFGPGADSLFRELSQRDGYRLARVTTFASMAFVPRTTGTRLVQVRAVTEAYPLYGAVTSRPPGRWRQLQTGMRTLVDPALLVTLDAQVGDSLAIGNARFEIVGTLVDVPGDPGIAATIGPRVFIPSRYLDSTQLLVQGSRAEYETLMRIPEGTDPDRVLAPLRGRLERLRIRPRTVAQNESNLTESIDQLGRFLGVVGLVALLLGGIGVASGVHAFVTRKVDTVAVLRCLGATSGQILLIYVAQSALMGLAGAAVGAALGVAIQFALPYAVRDLLPVNVTVQLEPRAILIGLAMGLWVALAFALRPLVTLRRVSPLQALRREHSAAPMLPTLGDWPRLLANLLLVASVVSIAATRARSLRELAGFSAGIAGALIVLTASAVVVSRLAKAVLRKGWPYVLRQGVANLYRPANQTRAVMLSLGFGAFLITTLFLVQSNLLNQFTTSMVESRANLVFFDVQEDQRPAVDSIIRRFGYDVLQRTPIVTMRIAEINGRTTQSILGDTTRRGGGWALRREYRSTYRDSLMPSETLVEGRPLGKTPVPAGATVNEVSLDREVARELRVALGDQIVWDVQGVKVPTRVTSLREINWQRLEPNFFAVFTTAAIDSAPKQFVLLSRVGGGAEAARVQRAIVDRYPNVSSIDLSLIRRTIDDIVRKVTVAIRFLAVFSLGMGVPVLFSAVAATRRERVREGVLLKTLGATRAQIGRILLAEYVVLGVLGSLTGMLLAFGGAWALLRFVFERPFSPVVMPAVAIAGAMVALTVSIGILSGRDVFRETPMAALREA